MLAFALLYIVLVATAEAAGGKNVLLIAIDDLRPDLACYGHRAVKSPNIDRLAGEGVLFERAYCQQAVCAPSRIGLLTGLRPDTTRIYGLAQPLRETRPKVLSMPQYFRRAGYETVSLGKVYHHRHDDDGVGWSVPAWRPAGRWKGRGYLTDEAIRTIRAQRATGGYRGVGPAFERADVGDGDYPDGVTAAKAIAELRRLKRGGKPFFLAVGFMKPHLPFNAPARYWDLYDPGDLAAPAHGAWPKGSPARARSNWGELRKYVGMPRRGAMPVEDATNLVHGYRACVSYVDALVGRVLAELDRLDLAGNTVVVLWGDHGWKLGDYGAWCKHTNFEIDTRVPLVLRMPGAKTAGRRTRALVETVDIFPTLAELCGLDVPGTCEGTSLAPLVEDPDRRWKDAAFSQYPRRRVMGYSLRSGVWRYTEWIHRRTGEIVSRELYDHTGGPTTARNLAGDSRHAETVKKLSALLDGGKGWRAVRDRLTD